MPKISILVPNYNNAAFLTERFDSILRQTWRDFEVIVCDSYSVDGAWDIISHYVAIDSRIKAVQVPKEGIYAGWNECIRRATGEYIYIATSDDSMVPECLERLLHALESHADCGLAMCALKITDQAGNDVEDEKMWRNYPAGKYFGSLWDVPHTRLAPLDGLLSATLHCIWHSVTQLLIRRSVFERHGLYSTDIGSIADFEWNARVGFFENVVYIPQELATLRVHTASASVQRGGYTVNDMSSKIEALKRVLAYLKEKSPAMAHKLETVGWLNVFYLQRWVYKLRINPVNAFVEGMVKFIRKPIVVTNLMMAFVTMAPRGKNMLRKSLTDKLLKSINLEGACLVKRSAN